MQFKKLTKGVFRQRILPSMMVAMMTLNSISYLPVSAVASQPTIVPISFVDIGKLPVTIYSVYGSSLDRGVVAAMTDNGVFLSWRFFPSEASGISGTTPEDGGQGLTGTNFVIFKNGELLDDVTNSTNYLDREGTIDDEYSIVTIEDGRYVSRSEPTSPAIRLTEGIASGLETSAYISIPVKQPEDVNIMPEAFPEEIQSYFMDHITTGDVDGDGALEFLVRWETASPDVINQGFQGPVLWDCYEMDGTLLWRLDLGVNIRPGQHYGIGMLYDFDGNGKAEFMVKTAPGSRSWEVLNGELTGNFTYIAEKFMGENGEPTKVTRWDGTRNWSPTDDYRTWDGNTTAETRLSPNTTVSWMSDFFYHWQSHPEVTSAKYGELLQFDAFSERGGFGWWKYPPQVMMGMYPAGYLGDQGVAVEEGYYWTYKPNENVAQWTEDQWNILKAMPTDPKAFQEHEMTREEADALALLWIVSSYDGRDNDRYRGSGQIMDGPEFYSVFDGSNGNELDTIEYAVPRGTFREDGSYVPDIGILWNDFATIGPEPYNRVNRHTGAVAYLDGETPSVVEERGYYSRTTITEYRWDGTNLSSNVFIDSGFEVLPNPFSNGVTVRGGAVAYSNTHGGPGRKELVFDPLNPRDENRTAAMNVTGQELVDWLIKNGSFTGQGNHTMYIMDIDRDGRDEVINGEAAFRIDHQRNGSLVFTGYEARWLDNTAEKDFTTIQKLGHGDSAFVGYFHPDQLFPQLYSCLEGSWWDAVLRNALTGAVMYTDAQGTAETWGTQRDNGRAMAGKYTSEPGWQVYSGREKHETPAGIQGGLRLWDGSESASSSSLGYVQYFLESRFNDTINQQ